MSRRRLGIVLAVLVVVAVGWYAGAGVVRARQMRAEIESLQREIATLKARAAELTTVIDRLRNDPAYIEKLAREEHGLVREGETVLKFPPKGR